MGKVLMIASESSHFRNFHMPYIERLLKSGVTVHTAANGVFEYDGVEHTELNFRKKITSPANIGVIFKLARMIRRERYDAVYTNSTLAGIAGRMAAKLSLVKSAECRHICHGYLFNDDGSRRAKAYLMCEKLVRKRTKLLAVMNRDDLEIARKYSLGREIVFLNGMGLDAGRFPALSDDEILAKRRKLGAESGVLFLCVGEFSERKNQTAMIQAMAKLRRTDCKLVFAGEGALMEQCKQTVCELMPEERVTFLGHCDNVNLLYRACDCLISASRFEGLPFNVMEALYCGEDIIVSAVKGNRDLAVNPRCVYPYGNVSRLAELMESYVRSSRINRLPERYLLENAFEENYGLLRYGDI